MDLENAKLISSSLIHKNVRLSRGLVPKSPYRSWVKYLGIGSEMA